MSKPGTLFVVSAPSGAGKTTLEARLIREVDHLVRSISMTTRAQRANERQGKDYFFVSEAVFKKHIAQGKFLEYAHVFGRYYGTPLRAVESALRKKQDVLLTIDVQGAMKIKQTYRGPATFIFILPPSMKVLAERLRARNTDSASQIKERLRIAKEEMAHVDGYDYAVVNDDLDRAFDALRAIIIASRCAIAQFQRR